MKTDINQHHFVRFIQHVIEYNGTGSWIYSKKILAWAFNASIVRQLPIGIRLFCLYVRFYSLIFGTKTIIFGHGIYKWLHKLDHNNAGSAIRLDISGHSVWLDLDDPGSLWAIQELSIGSTLASLIESLARDADVFIDIGANQGIFSAIVSRTIKPSSKIIAVEPQPTLADCVERTLRASKVRDVLVVKAAVSEREDTLELSIPRENHGEAHLHIANAGVDACATITANVTTLDTILSDIESNKLVVIKMDIEGAEIGALRGGKDFFRRCAPTLILEFNPSAMNRYGYSIGDMAQILAELGYKRWARSDEPNQTYPVDLLPQTYCDIVLKQNGF